MKTTLTLIFICCISSLVAAGDELVINGSFEVWEDGAPAGWTVGTGAGEGAETPMSVVSAVDDGTGGLALSLSGDVATKNWMVVSQDIDVRGLDEIVVRGRAAANDVRPDGHRYTNCQLMVIVYDAQGNYLDRAMIDRFKGTRDWAASEGAMVLHDDAAKATVSCFLSMSGEALFDDVSVTGAKVSFEPTGTRVGDWRLDFERLVELLEIKHPDPFRTVDRETYAAELRGIADRADELTDMEIVFAAQAATARLGDAHTRVSPAGDQSPPRLPLGFAPFGDGFRVTWAAEGLADMVGGRLSRCGDTPAAEAAAILGAHVSAETEGWRRLRTAKLLRFPSILRAVGLSGSDDAVAFTVVHDDGREITRTVALSEPAGTPATALPSGEDGCLRLSRKSANWVRHLPESRALYVRYGACRDLPGMSVCDLRASIHAALDTCDVGTLVLDLRDNGGGSSHQLRSVAAVLNARRGTDREVRPYVMTNAGTFSSGVLDAAYFALEAGAVVVGEPSGQAPDHFGQVWSGELPLSGTRVMCSTQEFEAMPGNPGWVPLDMEVAETWTDAVAGRDPALEAILDASRGAAGEG